MIRNQDDAVIPPLASLQCGLDVICGLSLLLVLDLALRVFSRYSSFPLSSKTNISKSQFDLDYCQALYREPLAWVIVQALPLLLTLTKLHMGLSCRYILSSYQVLLSYQVWQQAQFLTVEVGHFLFRDSRPMPKAHFCTSRFKMQSNLHVQPPLVSVYFT